MAANNNILKERYLVVTATIWFFVVLNSYIIWNPLAPILRFVPALLIVLETVQLSGRLRKTANSRKLLICLSLYFIWVTIQLSDNYLVVIRRITEFLPLLCIILWPRDLLYKVYLNIRKVVVFFAIGSAVLSILILLGFGERIPHLVLPAREALHVRLGMVYYLYGLFIADCHPVIGVSSRACGMLQEPGHFSILLGFIYMIDRMGGIKVNYWVVICGLFTFSPTFVLIVLFTELHNIFSIKNFKKIVIGLSIMIMSLVVLYNSLPSSIRSQVDYFAYGRNLESVVEAYSQTSSLTGALDERANDIAVLRYNKLNSVQYMFGGVEKGEDETLSDYRAMILSMGLLGVFLSTLAYMFIMVGIPVKMKVALGFAYLLIIVHRSWMLNYPYIFFLAYLVVTLYFQCRKYNQVAHSTNFVTKK